MPNHLVKGEPRVGALVGISPNVMQLAATLERVESGIRVTVQWSKPDDPWARWFVGDYASEADSELELPSRLVFRDSHGAVLLVGCRASGYSANVFGPGHGFLWAKHAVMGVDTDLDYSNPHGLRSDISGLRAWLGVSSYHLDPAFESDGDYETRLVASRQPDIKVPGKLSLRLLPGWAIEQDEERVAIRNLLWCETRSDSPSTWTSLLAPHLALRDLVMLSQWRRESCLPTHAMRLDDPIGLRDDKPFGAQWRSARSAKEDAVVPGFKNSRQREHLIRYQEIGVEGLEKWLSLRESHARALDPIVSSCLLDEVSALTLLAEVGPGIEALGYLLMKEDGMSARRAKEAPLRARLERILVDLGDVLPFEPMAWADGTVEAYNGLKHANRTLPDEVDMLNRWRETVLAVRAWVALRLGSPAEGLKTRLAMDPQASPYLVVG